MSLDFIIMILIFFVVCSFTYMILNHKKVSVEEIKNIKKILKNLLLSNKWYSIIVVIIEATLLALILDLSDFDKIKIIAASIILMVTSLVDYKSKTIPNCFVISLFIYRTILFAYEYLKQDIYDLPYLNISFLEIQINGFVSIILGSTFSMLLIGICLLGARALSREGLGLGDVKLLSVLAYTIGLYLTVRTIICSMIICLFVSIFLVFMGRKKTTDKIAFGPFIYIGYIFAVCFSIII